MDRRDVVLSRVAAKPRPQSANGEPAIFRLPCQAVLEDHHGSDDLAALQIRDVKRLDAQWRLRQAQRLLDLLQGATSSSQVARPLGLVQRKSLSLVARDRLQQRLLVATAGNPHVDTAPPAGAEPIRQRRGIGRERWDEHLLRYCVTGLCAIELLQEML